MIAGRNDPCPCGSGKKFKRCCLDRTSGNRLSLVPPPVGDPIRTGTSNAPLTGGRPPDHQFPGGIPLSGSQVPGVDPSGFHQPWTGPARWEPAWEIRRIQGRVEPLIIDFVRGLMGRDGLEFAVELFTLDDQTIEVDGPEEQLFGPWLLYTHEPIGASWSPGQPRDPTQTHAGIFLAERGHMLEACERTFIQACLGAVHSYFHVMSTDPGVSLRLRDLLLGTEHDVAERSSSRTLRPGHVLYARVVPFDGFALMVGTGAVVLGTSAMSKILAIRKYLREHHGEITPALLGDMEEDLRSLYLDERQLALNPPMPVMTNTDGDLIEYHEIHYEIDDAERAFQALRTLALGESESDLRSGATIGRDGRIRKIEFSWLKRGNRVHRGMETTSLGAIRINGRKLTAEVNSAKRARKIRSLIDRRLGPEARYQRTDARSIESATKKHRQRSPEKMVLADREQQRLMQHPEVIAQLRKLAEASYADWPDHPLPAFGGKTPLEAMVDPEGRDMVEALLTEFEQAELRRPEALRHDFTALRRRLGLEPRQG